MTGTQNMAGIKQLSELIGAEQQIINIEGNVEPTTKDVGILHTIHEQI